MIFKYSQRLAIVFHYEALGDLQALLSANEVAVFKHDVTGLLFPENMCSHIRYFQSVVSQ